VNESLLCLAGKENITVDDTVQLAKMIYANTSGGIGFKQSLRPYICPFHALIRIIPRGATVLDVGCGAGLFIALLAHLGRVRSAVGFDSNERAIEAAREVAHRFPTPAGFCFECRNAKDSWPAGRFNAVCLIDVLHHVSPSEQQAVIVAAANRVSEGGVLLYKDMVQRPYWRAVANRLHDGILAREWIHYANLADVISWANDAGLVLEARDATNMLWYGHEWCLFRRPN
jgi:2-polyprenyl-3-methyl-5-hydroxy-6-metoxy-1,4-benzoquinol methylase